MVRDEASVAATDYPEVNSVLQELLLGARALLGHRFIGMYLDGSLAIGDFDPGTHSYNKRRVVRAERVG